MSAPRIIHHDSALGRWEMSRGEPAPALRAIWGEDAQALYVYLPDPDAHCARAAAAGAAIVKPLEDTAWGSRGYYARDPGGFLWGFSSYRPAA